MFVDCSECIFTAVYNPGAYPYEVTGEHNPWSPSSFAKSADPSSQAAKGKAARRCQFTPCELGRMIASRLTMHPKVSAGWWQLNIGCIPTASATLSLSRSRSLRRWLLGAGQIWFGPVQVPLPPQARVVYDGLSINLAI